MIKFEGLRRWVLIVVMIVASLQIGLGVIATFDSDLFRSCFEAPSSSNRCVYGPSAAAYGIGSLLFIGFSFLLLPRDTSSTKRAWTIVGLAVGVFVVAMLALRLLISITSGLIGSPLGEQAVGLDLINFFFEYQAAPLGERSFSQDFMVLWINLQAFFVAFVVAGFYSIGEHMNSRAKPEKGRRAPREIWKATWPKLQR